MNKKLLILAIFFLSLNMLGAQTKVAFLEAAEEAMAEKNYYSSLVYYQNVLEFDDTDIDVRYKLAESAKNFMSYSLAEQNYRYVVENQKNNEYPDASYKLAYVKQMQGKYVEAKELYDLYLSENSGDNPYLSAKSDKERAACEWAINEINNPDETILIEKLGDGINTIYSDVAPAIYGDSLYFSSMRFMNKDDNRVSKILLSEDVQNANLYENDINVSELNVANPAFNTDRTKVFYTVCEQINAYDLRCDLYCKKINPDGTFTGGKKLPDFVNKEGFTSTQPTIGYYPEIDKEILYFVSDREGGKGKLDIWYSIIDNKDNFTAPVNLEDVNTSSDELTPFYHVKSNTLYFSSDGYRTFGGYDVYQAKKTKDGFGEVKHLNNPLNTSFHDIYFVLDESGENGYLASNRESATLIDQTNDACCFDLYDVTLLPIDLNLNAISFDKFSMDSLSGATVRLIDEDTGELIEGFLNNDGADHKFKLDRCRNYLVIGEKLGYKSDTIKLSTCDYKKSQEIIKKLFLEPTELYLNVLTYEKKTQNELNGVKVELIDMTDSSIEPVEITNTTANDFKFELIRGHEYKIVASKLGYKSAEIRFGTDNIGGIELTKKLYLDQDFESWLKSFLPLKLYFDNDRPDPKTIKRTSSKTYTYTYNQYISNQDDFVSNTTDPESMVRFFENDVKVGYQKLNIFLSKLENALNGGQSFELAIRGYASPRAQSNYNLILGQRRVFTVRNEIESYNEGALLKFIDQGQLKITDVSYGENLSPENVNDSQSNTRLSVYSVEASKERRVEIIDVNSTIR